jgi:hypothetical protein
MGFRPSCLMYGFSVDVFFRCDPCGSRVLHRPSFLASLLLHPKDPGFPHPAILHAIVELRLVSLTSKSDGGFSLSAHLPHDGLRRTLSRYLTEHVVISSQSSTQGKLDNISTRPWQAAWTYSQLCRLAYSFLGTSTKKVVGWRCGYSPDSRLELPFPSV